MKTTQTITVRTQQEFDLMALPTKEWPPEARKLALQVLASKRHRDHFQSLPPADKKAYLVDRIERLSQLNDKWDELCRTQFGLSP